MHATGPSGTKGIERQPCGVPPVNSDERREARRRRREERRAAKRAEAQTELTLEAVADIDSLHRAALEARRGVCWKASVQRYMKDVLRNAVKSRKQLLNGDDVRRGFYEFDLFERGKLRHITSVHYSERVVQKSLSQNVLVPSLTRSFIRNNTANTKGRGTDDAIARLKRDLVRHYRKHGTDGYILLVDFSNYFGSIDHGRMKRLVCDAVDDSRVCALEASFIDACGDVGLGLGSEPNQVCAVAFPDRIDHFVTEMCRVEGYGRYMDDSYLISSSKLDLQICLALIRDMCEQMGLTVNMRKTHIVKLSKGFTWLKKRVSYGENGRVVIRPCRDSITRERRKLKKQARLVRDGKMTVEQVERSYQSWRGGMLRLDAHRTLLRMDALYHELFVSSKKLSGGGFVALPLAA